MPAKVPALSFLMKLRNPFVGFTRLPQATTSPFSPIDVSLGETQMRPKTGIAVYGRPSTIGSIQGFWPQQDAFVLGTARGKMPYGPGTGGTFTPWAFDIAYPLLPKRTG